MLTPQDKSKKGVSMKISLVVWEAVKATAYIIVSLISLALTMSLFVKMHHSLPLQIILGGFGATLEIIKHIAWYEIKKLIIQGKRTFLVRLLHGGIVLISMVASYGFLKMSIINQAEQANRPRLAIEQQNNNINIISNYMTIISDFNKANVSEKEKLAEKEGVYYSGQQAVDEIMQENTDDFLGMFEMLKEEQSVKSNLEEAENVSIIAKDVFDEIGSGVIPGDLIQMILFIGLIIVLEIAICFTSIEVEEKRRDVDPSFIKKVTVYINALMDITGKRLNGDERIEAMTDLSISECKQFKDYLLNTSVNGRSLIASGRGGSKANYSKEAMINIVRNKVSIN